MFIEIKWSKKYNVMDSKKHKIENTQVKHEYLKFVINTSIV